LFENEGADIFSTPSENIKDAEGRPLHEMTWGPGYYRHYHAMAEWQTGRRMAKQMEGNT